jgi:DNA-binding GntR family transcriptional regulator
MERATMSSPRTAGPLAPRTSFAELAYRRLRDDILRQRLKPGAVISTAQIARSLGVSPMPVRAAITRLETEGLVSVLPQKGVVVARISITELEELFVIRSRVEALAAYLACLHMRKTELAQLRKLLQEMKTASRARNIQRWLSGNQQWHHLIYQASRNDHLIRLATELYQRGMARRVGTPNVEGHMERRYVEHLAILEAMEARQAEEVERLWRDHILRGGEEIIEYLRKAQKADNRDDGVAAEP